MFERQPLTQTLVERLRERRQRAVPSGDGNYLPALQEVRRLAKADQGKDYALTLTVIGDGAPSDHLPKASEFTKHGISTIEVANFHGKARREFIQRTMFARVSKQLLFNLGPTRLKTFTVSGLPPVDHQRCQPSATTATPNG